MKKLMVGLLAFTSISAFSRPVVFSNLEMSSETKEVLWLKGYSPRIIFDGVLAENNFVKGEAEDLIITLEASYDKQNGICTKIVNLSRATEDFAIRMVVGSENPVTGLDLAKLIKQEPVNVGSSLMRAFDNKRKCLNGSTFRDQLVRLPNSTN